MHQHGGTRLGRQNAGITVRPALIFISLACFFIAFTATVLYYQERIPGNFLLWVPWVVSCAVLVCAFLPRRTLKQYRPELSRDEIVLLSSVTIVYVFAHLFHSASAPWNAYGLFDDAAWDIYFAKNHIGVGIPFQAAYFDTVGYISREVVFHHYISVFFSLFGYNLRVFIASLILLGYLTVLFTVFIIHRLHGSLVLSVLGGVLITYFPLHFMHVYMGHRYAIAAPLMMMSYYYLLTSFKNRSIPRALIAGFFAALCMMGAVMGKHYIAGLVLSGMGYLLFETRAAKECGAGIISAFFVLGFVWGALPLLLYIGFYPFEYSIREASLFGDFFSAFTVGGIAGIQAYIDAIREVFFASVTYRRQFLHDFYAIPLPYYCILIPGLVYAGLKKRFEIIVLSIIPVVGAFVSGAYDFRVLHAVPMWIIGMTYGIRLPFEGMVSPVGRRKFGRGAFFVVVITICLLLYLGLSSSIAYINRVSQNPNHIYLLPHRDVAVSRLIQDLILGERFPNHNMKPDEFKRPAQAPSDHDAFVCPYSAYAILHLYLHEYDDRSILSFCNQGIQLLMTTEEVYEANVRAILNYVPKDKSLLLIWEVSDVSRPVIGFFRSFESYGSGQWFSGSIDGTMYELYILNIDKHTVPSFQADIREAVQNRQLHIIL